MRITNIINSIANVTNRFSVQGTSMLRANDRPLQQWHLNLCYWPSSVRHPRTDLLFGTLTASTGITSINVMPAPSEQPLQNQPVKQGLIQQLFQRLS